MSTGILVLILGFAGLVGDGGRAVYFDSSEKTGREQQARRVLDRLVSELSVAGRDTLFPLPDPLFGSAEIHFQQSLGFANGQNQWGPLTRIHLDCTGDGVADECRLVLTRNFGTPDAQEFTLCRGVSSYLEGEVPNADDTNGNGLIDERGFSLSLDQDVLTLRLTLANVRNEGPVVLRTLETALKLRN